MLAHERIRATIGGHEPIRVFRVGTYKDDLRLRPPPGGTVTLTVRAEPTVAVLKVRDTGRGIEPELLPRIFDLFVQGRQGFERPDGGLGIGLSLVKRLVEQHGGTVEARSDGKDAGSVFTVRLPPLAS